MALNIERAAGKIVGKVVPGEILQMSRLGGWYEKNESHQRQPGDVLVLRGNSFGFGRRPVAVVLVYEVVQALKGGMYTVEMYTDWVDHPDTGLNIRGSEMETHFKWNIENLFKKVPKGMSHEEAVSMYNPNHPHVIDTATFKYRGA